MKQRIVVSATALVLVGGVTAAAVFAVQNGTHQPRTINIAAGAAAGGSKTSSGAIDAAIAPMPTRDTSVTFALKGQLPALDGDQSAWQFPANPEPDPAALARLAKAFGVADVSIMSTDGVVVHGGPLQTGPAVIVNKMAGLPWAFNSASAVMEGGSCSASASSDPNVPPTPPVCTSPPKPANVPSAADAETKAIALLDAAGIDHANTTVTSIENDGWATVVQFVAKLDGIDVQSLTTMFSFGANGSVEYAAGYLAQPVKADSYPRIGTTAAFENLKTDGPFSFFGFPERFATGGGSIAVIQGVATSTASGSTVIAPAAPANAAEPPTTTAGGLVPDTTTPPPIVDQGPMCGTIAVTTIPGQAAVPQSCIAPCEFSSATANAGPPATDVPATPVPLPMPIQPCPAPQPRTVTIDNVRETLIDVSGTDGSRWLVPGYLFIDTDGGQWPVLAIDKSYIHIAPVPVTQPLPADGSSTSSATVVPETTAGGPCILPPPATFSLPPTDPSTTVCATIGTIVSGGPSPTYICDSTSGAPTTLYCPSGGATGSGGTPASGPKTTMVLNPSPPTT